MNRILDHLVAGLIAAALTGGVAGVTIWKITATQREFVGQQFTAQDAKIQAVGDALAKTADDLKRLDGALKATETTLHDVKHRLSLVGTRNGIARLDTMAEEANKALAALSTKLDDKTRDKALARIETAVAGVKEAIDKLPAASALAQANAKLDNELKALAALGKTADRLKSGTDADAAKLDAASKTLAALRTALDDKARDQTFVRIETAVAGVKEAIDKLPAAPALAQANAKLDNALKALAALGKTADGLKGGIDANAAKLDAASKTLAALRTGLDDKARDQTFARIETAIADVKEAIDKQPTAPALAQANAKLDHALKALAALGKTADGLKGGTDANAAKLADAAKSLSTIDQTLNAVKGGIGTNAVKLDQASTSIAALDTKVRQGFADTAAKQAEFTKVAEKPAPAPAPPQPAKPEQDLVVFYVSMTGAAPALAAASAPGLTTAEPQPLRVHYEKIGGVDDEGQAKLIVARLRAIMKGHSGCSIAVAGHADTLGGDRANYELSKKRATEVADKLKAAFAGEPIAITQTQWGERRLADWTPDETAREANRRVDITVSCEK